jgi:hypothetical protein
MTARKIGLTILAACVAIVLVGCFTAGSAL